MTFKERSITFQEFALSEAVPLSAIQEAVLEFVRGRDDALVFGAQAVNAHVDEPRMCQIVDIMAIDAETFAETLRLHLNERSHIAVSTQTVAGGMGFRIDQVRQPSNRHLVDIREIETLPECQRIEGVLVPTPTELITQKLMSLVSRLKTAKGMTDMADLRRILLKFPTLKVAEGAVVERLRQQHAAQAVHEAWQSIVAEEIEMDDDDRY